MSNAAKFYIVPAVLYALVASPMTYQKTRDVFGSWVATQDGLAKTGGLILHALVFILLAALAMRYFPSKRSGFSHSGNLVEQKEGMNTKLISAEHMLAPAEYKDI
jgi:hypothetical protein